MNLINIADIHIPEARQRREFDPTKLWELEDSIMTKGLMHPPVLKADGKTLIAGERRLRALKGLMEKNIIFWYNNKPVEKGMIPYSLLGDLSEDEIFEAELEENVLRVDLTWQEKAIAIDKLHALRTKQNPAQTLSNTAEELLGRKPYGGEASTLVRNSNLIVENLHLPEVVGAKSEKDAFKIIEKKIRKEHREKLSQEFKTLQSAHTLILGDSLQEMIAPEHQGTYDLIVTDPPYGMGADTFGTMALNDHNYDDSKDWFIENIDIIADHFYAITKPQAHCYIFCDIQNLITLQDALARVGWDVWRTPLIWYKGNMGMLPRPDHGPRRTYELCVYAIKGKKQTQLVGAHDVMILSNVQGDKDHAAQKPPSLYEELIKRSCLPGDKIIDPFCGSGPIFTAAQKTETVATGMELGDEAYAVAVERLQALSL